MNTKVTDYENLGLTYQLVKYKVPFASVGEKDGYYVVMHEAFKDLNSGKIVSIMKDPVMLEADSVEAMRLKLNRILGDIKRNGVITEEEMLLTNTNEVKPDYSSDEDIVDDEDGDLEDNIVDVVDFINNRGR